MIKNFVRKVYMFNKNHNYKISPRGALAFAGACIVAASAAKISVDNYKRIELTEGFDNVGYYAELEDEFKIENLKDSKYVMFECNGWEEGFNEKLSNNVGLCNENDIPCGIVMESNSKSSLKAKADAYNLLSSLEGKKVECPIYYDIKDKNDTVVDVYNSFKESIQEVNDNLTVGLKIDMSSAADISDTELVNETKLFVSDTKYVNYNDNTSMVYSSRTGNFYSPTDFRKEEEDLLKTGKGIDVSYSQGNIDWGTIKEQGVEYALIRINTFEFYHFNGDLHMDRYFYDNIKGCEENNIPYGLYTYNNAKTTDQAVKEANIIADILDENNIKPVLPVFADIESNYLVNNPKEAAIITELFCKTLADRGYETSVYSSRDMFLVMSQYSDYIKNLDNKWVALYSDMTKEHFTEITEDKIGNMKGLTGIGIIQVSGNAMINGVDNGKGSKNLPTTVGEVDVNIDVSGMTDIKVEDTSKVIK